MKAYWDYLKRFRYCGIKLKNEPKGGRCIGIPEWHVIDALLCDTASLKQKNYRQVRS